MSTVKTVIGEKVLSVKILTDKITPYMMAANSYSDFDNLSPEPLTEDIPELLAAIPESHIHPAAQYLQGEQDQIWLYSGLSHCGLLRY
ncbi:MAG: hypothetical protein RQM95_12090 [Syntrophaceticus schinkii]